MRSPVNAVIRFTSIHLILRRCGKSSCSWSRQARGFHQSGRLAGDMFRLFEGEDHAKAYAQFRPRYPSTVYDTILKYCMEGGAGHALAVDVACGSGQSTLPLAETFDRVIGVDHSQAQIEQAPKDLTNVEFRTGAGEDLSFMKSNSADLVTVAQGLHWLDQKRLFAEAKRVLRPGGAFIAYGYGLCKLDCSEADKLLQEFHTVTLRDWWDKERKLVDDLYKDIHLPFRDFVRNHNHSINREMRIVEFVSYLDTFSAWQKLLKSQPGSTVMQEMTARLNSAYADYMPELDRDQLRIQVTWPIFILMGRA